MYYCDSVGNIVMKCLPVIIEMNIVGLDKHNLTICPSESQHVQLIYLLKSCISSVK